MNGRVASALFSAAYLAASLLDIATTQAGLARGFVEVNPLVAGVVSKPALWLLRDVASLLATLALAHMCRAIAGRLAARAKPRTPREAARLEKLPSTALKAVLLAAATLRWLPPIHNTLLLYTGIETTLPQIFEKLLATLSPVSLG